MSLPSTITFISAGAGSGKTYQLTELLLERLRARSAEPDVAHGCLLYTSDAADE